MHKNQSVQTHRFAMVPRADIPRSSFNIQTTHKTTFDSGYLVPVFCEEILPGDTFSVNMTAFARLSTPLFPVMDNLHLDSFFFFVPNRLVWDNWQKFMGEQTNPGDSISYVVPQHVGPSGGYAPNTLQDYFGLPTQGQITVGQWISHNALPLRGYNLIYNEWFRDENLQNSVQIDRGDGPDNIAGYILRRRGKRPDYFTTCLPWPQKGGTAITIPLGGTAPVKSDGTQIKMRSGAGVMQPMGMNAALNSPLINQLAGTGGNVDWGPATQATTGLYADLSAATAATINQLRQSFQIQKLLERDARGGTRYTEIIYSHFGVKSPDARLQRPEYLGGGSTPIIVQPVAQTSSSSITGSTTPLGQLGGVGTALTKRHGFTASFTEHGYVLGLVQVRADLTYQQGLRKMWSRNTRYDFYFPAFAALGEQAVLKQEIYCTGTDVDDNTVFGYQERWAEYRYSPSKVTGLFRSTSAGTIDPWHLAQRFTSTPVLNATFIEDTPPLERILAVGVAANGKQLIFDSFFDIKAARPMPMYSVPGLIDHF